MDFVRAQMTEADRAAERQYEMVKAATAEAIRESTRVLPLTPQQVRMNAWSEQRERAAANRRKRERRAHFGLQPLGK